MVDRVRIAVAPSARRAVVLGAVSGRLPANLMAEVPAGKAAGTEDVLHSAHLGLDFVTALTVAMAWFIVGNAMLINVTERRCDFSLLRLLGATNRQVRRLMTGGAAVLGGLGALLGAEAGLAAAGPIAAE